LNVWKWKARDEQGNVQWGIEEEQEEGALISRLRGQKLYPVSIKPVAWSWLWKRGFANPKLYWSRVAGKFGALLEAGLPLLVIMDIIKDQEKNRFRQNQWTKAAVLLGAGYEFSASLKVFFPSPGLFFQAMVLAGEKSGTLAASFLETSKQLEEEYFFEKKIKTVLFYPSLLLAAAIAVLYLLSTMTLPMYEKLFAGLNADLPLLTVILFKAGSGIPYFLGIGTVILVLLVLIKKKRPVSWPGTGKILKLKTLVNFCSIFHRLLEAGIPLLESLSLLKHITKEKELSLLINQLSSAVREGQRLTPVFEASKYFPREAAAMLAVGEESGRLAEMFEHVAVHLKKELEENLEYFARLLEPVLVLGMAGLVALVAVGVLLPIFDASTHIQ